MLLPPPVLLQEHDLILIAVLLILGGAMLGAILHAAHRASLTTPKIERRNWLALLGFAILAIGLTHPGANSGYISPADQIVLRPAPATKLTIDTSDCGPRAPGHTDQLIFTIESRADADPVVTGCTRIAKQQYVVNSQKGK
jgi:hypothetical protein